jgi:glycosyltransferase involved in cell wall biosynthesis
LLGPVSDARLLELYQHAAFFVLPGEEDFGIAPVEAQACGRPVLALGRGGALETVRAGETGVFFAEPTEESLLGALPAIDALARDADPAAIRVHAARFSSKRFGPELRAALEELQARATRA